MKCAEEIPLPQPTGPVVARFRSLRLGWTDPDSGDRLTLDLGDAGDPRGAQDLLAELERQGFRRLSEREHEHPPGGGERTLGASGLAALPDERAAGARGDSVSRRMSCRVRLSQEEGGSR